MKILAIDPGNTKSGYVVWDGTTVLEAAVAGNETMRAIIVNHLRAGTIDQLAIEVMTNTHNQPAGATVIDTIFWSGRFFEAHEWTRKESAPKPHRVDRSAVTRYLCGKVVGDKEVSEALDRRFPNLPVSGHCRAALAVAVFALDHITGEKSGKPFELAPPPKTKPKKKAAAPGKKKFVPAKKKASKKR